MANKTRRKASGVGRIPEPAAAGADVGAEEIYVAVSNDRDDQPVRRFTSFTRDLHALAAWLQKRGIPTSYAPTDRGTELPELPGGTTGTIQFWKMSFRAGVLWGRCLECWRH
jgi:hypothetical protein